MTHTLNPPKLSSKRRIAIGTIVVCLAASLTSAATHVKDEGKFFSSAAVKQAEVTLEQLQQKTNRNVIVETFGEPPESVRGQIVADASKRDRVFERFALERAASIRADVYVMANRTPGYLRVAENNSLQAGVLPAAERAQVSQTMLDAFKQKQFDQGLAAGVNQIASFLGTAPAGVARTTATPSAQDRSREDPPAAPVMTGNGTASRGMFGGINCCTIAGIGLLVIIVIAVVRRMGNRNRGGFNAPTNYGGGPPAGGYPQQGGFPQQGGYPPQAGGGFGRGIAGGLLGGVLGSVLGNQWSHGRDNAGGNVAGGGTPADSGGAANDNTGYSSSGGSFDAGGDDSSGGSFDSGGDSGGDSGSSGGDF